MKNCYFKVADARSLPFHDKLFNVVFVLDVLEHIKEIERLNKIRSVVAHSYWVEGSKKDAIKPVGIKKRGKSLFQYMGLDHNEKEWTADELNKEAEAIMREADALSRLLVQHGLGLEL